MKLFYVINGLGPGGAERSLADLLPYYRQAQIDPTVICLRRRENSVEQEVQVGGNDVRFLKGGSIVTNARELRRLIGRERPDLIHTTIFEADVVARFAASGTKIPLLTSLVNTSYDSVRLQDPNVRRLGLLATRLLDGWTARHLTTHFHAITHAVKDAAVVSLGIDPAKVTVVERGRNRLRLGVSSRSRRASVRAALGLREDEQVLVSVGRQEFQKGQRFLIDAVARVAAEHPKMVLLLLGREGHATQQLKEAHAASGLGDRIRFMGFRSDVPDVLAASDIFVFPSLYEGLGGAVIEAMALGLPIIASDIPALREVVEVERNACLVEPGNPEPLADAIAKLLRDDEKARSFGERSLQIFEDRFTIERSSEGMIALYRKIAGPYPSGGARRLIHTSSAPSASNAPAIPYTVRACTTGDEEAILGLLAITVGETIASRKTAEFWRWKHGANPFGPSFVVGAFDPLTGGLAGLRALMWWRFTAPGGASHRAVRAVDTATHPSHQRKGIFSALTEFAVKEVAATGADFVFNTPNDNSLPGYLKMGWSVVERWPLYMRPTRPVRLASRLLRRMIRGGGRDVLNIKDLGSLTWTDFCAHYGTEVERVVTASEVSRPPVGYRTLRTREYLDWRYGAHPDIEYRVLAVETSGQLGGFAIGRSVPGAAGLRSLVITELFVDRDLSTSRTVLKDMLSGSASDYAVCHFPLASEERAAATSLGFVRAPRRGYTFVSRGLRPLEIDPSLADSWDLTLGELEIF